MRRYFFGLLTLILFGCSAAPAANTAQNDIQPQMEEPAMIKAASLPDLGPAPELTNDTWLNVDAPLRLADLQGKVVIIDMWTFGCINCQHVIPSLKDWHSKYADQGLVIIGNHYPEFSYERELENVKDAIAREGIEYAVAQDNDGKTWRAYKNHYWPTLYLIDKQGHIRYVHIGEGKYNETEENIKALLAEEF
jgi:thiol-disulfide isomerase/thioredoxin